MLYSILRNHFSTLYMCHLPMYGRSSLSFANFDFHSYLPYFSPYIICNYKVKVAVPWPVAPGFVV